MVGAEHTGAIVVLGPELEEERRIYPSECNYRRIEQLDQSAEFTEAITEELERIRDTQIRVLAIVARDEQLFGIARSQAEYSAPSEVRDLVERAGGRSSTAPVLAESLVQSFLR